MGTSFRAHDLFLGTEGEGPTLNGEGLGLFVGADADRQLWISLQRIRVAQAAQRSASGRMWETPLPSTTPACCDVVARRCGGAGCPRALTVPDKPNLVQCI